MSTHRKVVAGLGNELLCDDGVGVHAARALTHAVGTAATVWEIGTAIWHLASLLQPGDDVLALDAVAAGGAPGSLYYFEGPYAQSAHRAAGAHGMGVFELMQMMPPAQRPARLAVLGVEPACLAYGMQLSSPAAQAVPQVVARARRWLELTDTTAETLL